MKNAIKVDAFGILKYCSKEKNKLNVQCALLLKKCIYVSVFLERLYIYILKQFKTKNKIK